MGSHSCISQERGNRIDFMGKMKAGEVKNRKDQALEVEGESTELRDICWAMWKQCSRNSLESISMVLAKSPRNGEYRA